ncbi:MAG: CcmD family protein [Ardenticatenia bacterium]|nr:CcmD family protein [Ardenticatenia bacterium]
MDILADDNLPYLVGGYVAFWALIVGYLWSLRRREQVVRRELAMWLDEEEA